MINKQDSYWTEYTLDEKVDQKVCVYLMSPEQKNILRIIAQKHQKVV